MENASTLELELEQELLLESEQEQVSTPRQRLEDARAMDVSHCCGSVAALGAAGGERAADDCISYIHSDGGESLQPEGEEQDTSTHLLQVRLLYSDYKLGCCLR